MLRVTSIQVLAYRKNFTERQHAYFALRMHTQITDTLVMVAPTHFGFNEETAADNEFQHRPKDGAAIRQKAQAEFDAAVAKLRDNGVRVVVLPVTPGLPPLPDAIFPNNWFGTEDGVAYIFPMASANRAAEVAQWPTLQAELAKAGLQVKNVARLDGPGQPIVEGTGSLVLDRVGRVAYAALSVRTELAAVEAFARQARYDKVVAFHTQSRAGKPFYHTNVVMAIGDGFAVVCLEAVPDLQERAHLEQSLAERHQVIPITLAQAEQSFCANILQVKGAAGPITVMSQSAYDGFTDAERKTLEQFGPLLPIAIPTIEHVGGGSARCMMAEVFLT